MNTLGWFAKNGPSVVAGVPAGMDGPEPGHLKRYRRTFYLISSSTLYYRLSLLQFSWELSRVDELVANAVEVGRLHWRFLQLTNNVWFSHLTNAEYGNAIWRCWKEVIETEQPYEEVKV